MDFNTFISKIGLTKKFLQKVFCFLFTLQLFFSFSANAWMPIGALTLKRLSLLAGKPGADVGPGIDDGPGAAARFNFPSSMATDASGNIYVADSNNNTIRKITPAGTVSTLAGAAGASGSADGLGAAARFYNPSGVATDSSGNIYVADTYNNAIRKITPAGVVTTIAGFNQSPQVKFGALPAYIFRPQGVSVANGRLYITSQHVIVWMPLP